MAPQLPRPFIFRKLHSFLGLWLVIYLFQHLLINARAALYFYDGAKGFISMVDRLENLPYLPVIEVVFLGLPFLIHGVWGVLYLRSAKYNSSPTDGSAPALPQYRRNKAYTWQRITSWALLPLILFHIVQMRFVDRPLSQDGSRDEEGQKTYMIRIQNDPGLPRVTEALQAHILEGGSSKRVNVASTSSGVAFFLMLRDTFKSPLMVILYSILVVGACYHAFNGLWTAMICWGIIISQRAQHIMRICTHTLMALTTALGLFAIWGIYWTFQFS